MNLATEFLVYLLEKDTEITKTIHDLCNEKSLQLHCFDSGNELLNAIRDEQPSCIITANDQPNGQALSLMDKLASHEQQIPVIILGGHNDIAGAVAAIKAGAIDYIEKPTIYGRLAENLNKVIKGSAF